MRRFGTLKSIAVRGRLEVFERKGVGSGVIELRSERGASAGRTTRTYERASGEARWGCENECGLRRRRATGAAASAIKWRLGENCTIARTGRRASELGTDSARDGQLDQTSSSCQVQETVRCSAAIVYRSFSTSPL